MNRSDTEYLQLWFSDYTARYRESDDPDTARAVRLKEDHTHRVCENIILLGKDLGLSDKEMRLARIIALFHDIGRFRQYSEYRTFRDIASENHARLGLREIARHKVLSVCTPYEKRIIAKAVAHHNAVRLPEEQDKNTLFFMQLIRDADKLDIWNVVTVYYRKRDKQRNVAIELELPDDPVCSPQVIRKLSDRQPILMRDLKTLDDFKLMQISWAFDLNFAPSFQMLEKRGYIGRIEATLSVSDAIREAIGKTRDYVRQRIRSNL